MNAVPRRNSIVGSAVVLSAVIGMSDWARAQQRCAQCLVPGQCRWCGGDGIKDRCSSCNGTGRQRNIWPEIAAGAGNETPHYTSCSSCYGTGNQACYHCNRSGRCSHCVAGYVRSGSHADSSAVDSTASPSWQVIGWDTCFWCGGSGEKVFLVDLYGQSHSTPCPVCTGRGTMPRYALATTSPDANSLDSSGAAGSLAASSASGSYASYSSSPSYSSPSWTPRQARIEWFRRKRQHEQELRDYARRYLVPAQMDYTDEERAQSKLHLAKLLLSDGLESSYRKWLDELVRKYPDTEAAREATDLLVRVGRRAR